MRPAGANKTDFKRASGPTASLDTWSTRIPSAIAFYAVDATSAEPWPLVPAELECIRSCSPSRKREFSLGRTCAKRALLEIGLAATPIRVGADRAPIWPEGVRGSITHTAGFVAACATTSNVYRYLGLDAERFGSLTSDLWPHLFTAREADWLGGQDERFATVTFSAKEAFFKAVFPVYHVWLDFTDVEIVFVGDRWIARMIDQAKLRLKTEIIGTHFMDETMTVTMCFG